MVPQDGADLGFCLVTRSSCIEISVFYAISIKDLFEWLVMSTLFYILLPLLLKS